MDVLKENQSQSFNPHTYFRNAKVVSYNGKENVPSYKNRAIENEKSLQNLSRDEKLQLYEFDDNDPPETKRSFKKRQYRKKKYKVTKLNKISPAITNVNINDTTVSGKISTPLPFEDIFTKSSLASTPICGSTPLSRKKMVPVIHSPSVAAGKPPTQTKNIKQHLNLENATKNEIDTSSYSKETPEKSITFCGFHSLPRSPFSYDFEESRHHQSFTNNRALSFSTPITNTIQLVSNKKPLSRKDTNEHLSAPVNDMFGFEDYFSIPEEILPIPNRPNNELTSNIPSLPQLLTINEIQTLLEKDTSVFDSSLNSTTPLESSTFLMDTSLVDCDTPNLVDTSIEMNDTAFSAGSNAHDDILITHSRKGSRKFYSPGRRGHSLNKRKFHDFEKLEEPLMTSAMKKKKINKLNKKEEEHFDKLADVLNSTFKKIEEFQLAFE